MREDRSWATAEEIAADIRENLERGDESHALRLLLDGVNRLPYAAQDGCLDEALSEPATTSDPRWDLLLAGSIRYRLHQMSEIAPRWTVKEPLGTFWWPVKAGGARAACDMANTPAELKRLGVFISRRDFAHA